MIGTEQFLTESGPLKILGSLAGELHFGNRIRFHYVQKEIQNLSVSPKKILDAGCGTGQLSFWLAKKFPAADITGIDINPANIQHCRILSEKQSLTGRISFQSDDLQNPTSLKKYDLIICIDVLEHIPDFKKAALNLVQSLNKGGVLIIHTPQKGKYMDLKFGFRRFFKPQSEENEHDNHAPGALHIHDGLSKEELQFLKDAPFKGVIKDTFNSNIMLLHTIFESYREKSRIWHIWLTPLLTLLALPQMDTPNNKGGGLLIIIQA